MYDYLTDEREYKKYLTGFAIIACVAREAGAAVLVDQVIAGRSIFARIGLTFVDICTNNSVCIPV